MLNSTSHALVANAATGPIPDWGLNPVKGVITTPRGDIEYAVFGPGKFGQFLADNGIGAADPNPIGSGQLLYAYQIINVPAAPSTMNTLSKITVGDCKNNGCLGTPIIHNAATYAPSHINPGVATATNEQDPNHSTPSDIEYDAGQSFVWNFSSSTNGQIQGAAPFDEDSSILYYVAPYLPEKENVTIYRTGTTFSSGPDIAGIGPTFIPEPSTMCLVVLAAIGLLPARRSRG
jgi:hypothetical protein